MKNWLYSYNFFLYSALTSAPAAGFVQKIEPQQCYFLYIWAPAKQVGPCLWHFQVCAWLCAVLSYSRTPGWGHRENSLFLVAPGAGITKLQQIPREYSQYLGLGLSELLFIWVFFSVLALIWSFSGRVNAGNRIHQRFSRCFSPRFQVFCWRILGTFMAILSVRADFCQAQHSTLAAKWAEGAPQRVCQNSLCLEDSGNAAGRAQIYGISPARWKQIPVTDSGRTQRQENEVETKPALTSFASPVPKCRTGCLVLRVVGISGVWRIPPARNWGFWSEPAFLGAKSLRNKPVKASSDQSQAY